MPRVQTKGEFYQPRAHGGAMQSFLPSTDFATTIPATSGIASPLYTSDGFAKITVAAQITQAGSISVQRYVDPAGALPQGTPQSAALAANTAAVLNIADGLPFGSFTVTLNNSAGSAATVTAVQVLLQSV